MSDNIFTYKIDTSEYLSIEDFTNAIIAIDKEYRVFTGNSSELQIKEIRKGSFEVEFVSIAIPSLFVAINNANSIFEFCNYIKNAWNCLISPTPNSIEQNKLTEKTINNCYEISKPIINNNGTINIICDNGNVSLTTPEARKIRNNKSNAIKQIKQVEIIEDQQSIYKKQLFYWHQTCFDEKNQNIGNRGIIEEIQKESVKVIFEDDNSTTKKEMTTSQDGIDWQKRGYIVDVEVVRRNNKIVLYKIINNYMKDSIVEDIPQLPFN